MCGIVGIIDSKDAARSVFFSQFALQHRGQESAGIASTDGEELYRHRDNGLINTVFNEEKINRLKGDIAIGHNRYSTQGSLNVENAQPFFFSTSIGRIAIAHNGNVESPNNLESDTEYIGQLLVEFLETYNLEDSVAQLHTVLKGTFSLLIMTKDSLVATRDKWGIRPLCVGILKDGGYIIASESCALTPLEAEWIGEINPGKILSMDRDGSTKSRQMESDYRPCLFEFAYNARPDSIIAGKSVYEVRKAFGKALAKQHWDRFPEVDLVVPVPDTSIPAAIGFSEVSGIPFEEALVKNRYIHRTFIEPSQTIRDSKVASKLSPIPHLLEGKSVIVIDDSIVRGTTSKRIIEIIRNAGAREVHFMVASPPVMFPDYSGINIASTSELIAAHLSTKEIKEEINADSLTYLSMDDTLEAVGIPNLYVGPFTGEYPYL